ncbi:MAG: spermidine/putrescine ABC transporter substrate-binding protein [bacterium]|nr:spermidine/putrescine ABC transporter substrate-binding protein [bacterium]
MRRITMLVFTVLFAIIGLSSSIVAQDEEIEPWVCPEGFEGQSLSVYNWSTYIGENTISDFEELCGVTVTYDVYDSNESLVARLRQGNPGFDVAVPNDYVIPVMVRENLIQPIDVAQIPNFANVAEEFRGLAFDPENEYTVPYLWGTTGVAYNTEYVGEAITSWEQVFNYDGPVAWVDDARVMLGIALLMLGYDMSTTDPDQIEEAKNYLIENGDNVFAFAQDDGEVLLETGEVDIAIEYGGDIFQLITNCECETYAYVIPDEGSIGDIANLVLLTDAPNPELAVVFMDYILHPQVGADITNYTFYPSPNGVALERGLIEEELLTNPAITPDEEARQRLTYFNDVGESEELYINAWEEVKIALR